MNTKELFSVSIKGVLVKDDSYLMRMNQRDELELLGGRLEPNDSSAEDRIRTEFLEESGISVNVITQREPWLYVIAKKNIIIVPFICSIISMPAQMVDIDGGSLHWIRSSIIESCNIPRGYVDSIRNNIPRKSFSRLPGEYFKIIPNYTEKDYYVKLRVQNHDGDNIYEEYLPRFVSPRTLLKTHFKDLYDEDSLVSLDISKGEDDIVLNYLFL